MKDIILIVEDDPIIAESLSLAFKLEGFQFEISENLAIARNLLSEKNFSLILLDVNLPDGKGFDLAREVSSSSKTAIIIMTSNIDEESAIRGFESGAIDYVRKPFSNKELLMRVKRFASSVNNKTLVHNTDMKKFYYKEDEMKLSAKEYALLSLFYKRFGHILTREEISDIIDPEAKTIDRTIDSHLSHLRKKFKQYKISDYKFVSYYGSGYSLERV